MLPLVPNSVKSCLLQLCRRFTDISSVLNWVCVLKIIDHAKNLGVPIIWNCFSYSYISFILQHSISLYAGWFQPGGSQIISYWLPVNCRVHFKEILIVYKQNNVVSPEYLNGLLIPCGAVRPVVKLNMLKKEWAVTLQTNGLNCWLIWNHKPTDTFLGHCG